MENDAEVPQSSDAQIHNTEARAGYKRSLISFYTSHFLFTWNDRVWEFASIILLVAAYPQTLLPSSLFGLLSTGSAILFGPLIGRWFDMTARLKSVRFAIISQRLSVSAGCVCLWAMIAQALRTPAKDGLFAVVILLGCLTKLSFVGKTVGIERDWVRRILDKLIYSGGRDKSIGKY